MTIHRFFNRLILFTTIILFTGCMPVKRTGVKSVAKLFETFFIGEKGTQYFIKPLLFKNERNEVLELDITFRYKELVKDSATLNISIMSPEIIKSLYNIELSNTIRKIELKSLDHLFSEKHKNIFTNRYSSKVLLSEIEELFDHNSWTIFINNKGKYSEYKASQRTMKSIGKLEESIFILF